MYKAPVLERFGTLRELTLMMQTPCEIWGFDNCYPIEPERVTS